MERSDEELIEAYLGGEQGAFEVLAKRHLSGVYSFVVRFVGSPPEAEDIAQDTFVKAWGGLAKYDAQKSSFKTWLLRIARNTSIDFLRKKKHVPLSHFENEGGNVLEQTVADPNLLPDELLAQVEDAAELARALGELTPRHREILLLYYTNDLTFEEIGSMLGEPANTAKSRHRRALAALREVLSTKKAL